MSHKGHLRCCYSKHGAYRLNIYQYILGFEVMSLLLLAPYSTRATVKSIETNILPSFIFLFNSMLLAAASFPRMSHFSVLSRQWQTQQTGRRPISSTSAEPLGSVVNCFKPCGLFIIDRSSPRTSPVIKVKTKYIRRNRLLELPNTIWQVV